MLLPGSVTSARVRHNSRDPSPGITPENYKSTAISKWTLEVAPNILRGFSCSSRELKSNSQEYFFYICLICFPLMELSKPYPLELQNSKDYIKPILISGMIKLHRAIKSVEARKPV